MPKSDDCPKCPGVNLIYTKAGSIKSLKKLWPQNFHKTFNTLKKKERSSITMKMTMIMEDFLTESAVTTIPAKKVHVKTLIAR